MDLEIKEASIATMGTLVASMGDSLSAAQLEQVWAVFGKRLEVSASLFQHQRLCQQLGTDSRCEYNRVELVPFSDLTLHSFHAMLSYHPNALVFIRMRRRALPR